MDDEIKVTDRRASRLVVGQTVAQAKRVVTTEQQVQAALSRGRAGVAPTDMSEARGMQLSRLASANFQAATPRPRDPEFYWRQNNELYDTDKEDDLRRLRKMCRILYRTHPLLSSAIDIYSKWPIVGMEFTCKDPELVDFYTSLFIDQLDYEEFLGDIGREYWTVGEAWPLGSFNEDLGVWEDDELLNPDDVFVEKSPFLKDARYSIRLPETLRTILSTRQPAHEYQALVRAYPELLHFTYDNARMPVSGILLKQLKFKGDTFNPRGVPIMMRGLRAIMQEEMLNAAQDAIADRLYTPLILAKLGASATELGTTEPWIPTAQQIADFQAMVDVALAGDFRMLTTHFATDMSTVFGKETMPNFDADFERLGDQQLQVFGLSRTMLSGAGSGETYAADALNRDLVSQLLSTYQRYLQRFVHDRMLVVAEAQGHFDWEMRGGKKYPVMEEVLIVDEETGQPRVVEQPKLLVPDLKLKAMNMRDEQNTQQLFEALAATGVPISMQSRLINVPIDFDDEIEKKRAENIQLAVEAQETRKELFLALDAKGLPIPADLEHDFRPKAIQAGQATAETAAPETRVPQLGVDDPDHAALAPTLQDLSTPPGQPLPEDGTSSPKPGGGAPAAGGDNVVVPLSRNRARPPESDEMRAGMPRPASLAPGAPAVTVTASVKTEEGEDKEVAFEGGLIAGPKHIGSRRYVKLDADVPLEEQELG